MRKKRRPKQASDAKKDSERYEIFAQDFAKDQLHSVLKAFLRKHNREGGLPLYSIHFTRSAKSFVIVPHTKWLLKVIKHPKHQSTC